MSRDTSFIKFEDHHKVFFLGLVEFLQTLRGKTGGCSTIFSDQVQFQRYLEVIRDFYGGSYDDEQYKRHLGKVNKFYGKLFTESWGEKLKTTLKRV